MIMPSTRHGEPDSGILGYAARAGPIAEPDPAWESGILGEARIRVALGHAAQVDQSARPRYRPVRQAGDDIVLAVADRLRARVVPDLEAGRYELHIREPAVRAQVPS